MADWKVKIDYHICPCRVIDTEFIKKSCEILENEKFLNPNIDSECTKENCPLKVEE